jgi:hypothetical protein
MEQSYDEDEATRLAIAESLRTTSNPASATSKRVVEVVDLTEDSDGAEAPPFAGAV